MTRAYPLILLVCFLTACQTITPTAPSAPTLTPAVPPRTTATVAPTPLPSPTPGAKIFTLGLPAAPDTLDPANAVSEAGLLITRHLYEGLTAYEPGGTGIVPALAERWETTDARLWTFQLREAIKFSDGTPITASVVAANFERWNTRQPAGAYAFWRVMFGGFARQSDAAGQPLSQLVALTVTDASTFQLLLAAPDAALPATLAMPAFAIVQPEAFQRAPAQLETTSAGSGPFILKDHTEGLVHLERNPTYWGAPPAPDELVFKVIPDDTQRLLALQVGEINGMARVNPADYTNANAGATRVDFDPALNVLYLGFNQARVPWGQLECRQAVVHALDRARYVKDFFPGDAQVAQAVLPPAVWGAPTTPAPLPEYDPAQAQQLWQTCVETVGRRQMPESLTLYVPPLPRDYLPNPAGLGAALQTDLQAVGISVTVTSPAWSLWLTDVHAGRADLFVLGWVGLNGDPDSFLCPLLCGAEGAFNNAKGTPLPPDADLAALLQQARAQPEPAQRAALYTQAQQRLAETLPLLPLSHRQTAWAYQTAVQGNQPSPIEDVFFELK